MQFMPVQEDPKQYLDLLLLADESETMIESYLERGTLFVLQEPEGVIGVCVVTDGRRRCAGNQESGHRSSISGVMAMAG